MINHYSAINSINNLGKKFKNLGKINVNNKKLNNIIIYSLKMKIFISKVCLAIKKAYI